MQVFQNNLLQKAQQMYVSKILYSINRQTQEKKLRKCLSLCQINVIIQLLGHNIQTYQLKMSPYLMIFPLYNKLQLDLKNLSFHLIKSLKMKLASQSKNKIFLKNQINKFYLQLLKNYRSNLNIKKANLSCISMK